jgi:protein TonB
MRAKVQGIAVVGCVIEIDGHPSNCHIVHSLDSAFGLDLEAMKAASLWRFRPGTRMGEPVRVEITIEMSFTLR